MTYTDDCQEHYYWQLIRDSFGVASRLWKWRLVRVPQEQAEPLDRGDMRRDGDFLINC